ncbi:MAG: OmpA family protein [Candidatus Marinimicrobia bacterium]|nr:OmpA family protein [Candidatus Neomarinimicrobiota bacterium]
MAKFKRQKQSEDYWTYVSDVMTGLTIIFLFISINYISNSSEIAESAKDIVIDYQLIKQDIASEIKEEFSDEFEDWEADFDPTTLAFKFNSSEVLFKKGKAELSDQFKNILDIFFPRYIFIIKNEQFRNQISAIQIEGHTSSDWGDGEKRGLEAYLKNMKLSQKRSSNVLKYVLNIYNIGEIDLWTRNILSSIGYSSSKILYNVDGQSRFEDEKSSRRVSFKLIIDAESKLNKIKNIGSIKWFFIKPDSLIQLD